jgi:hypothetical protein
VIAGDNLPGDYDNLPEPVKQMYSPREYLWLSDKEKSSLVQRETEPEAEEP